MSTSSVRLALSALAGMTFGLGNACAQGAPKADRPRSLTDGQTQPGQQADTAAVRQFTQGFYDWYMSRPHGLRPSSFVLGAGRRFIQDGFASALRVDSISIEDPGGLGFALDSDPFLDSQDPCPRYGVTGVTSTSGRFRVAVRPICPDPISQNHQSFAKPSVEVVSEAGGWRIANVFYENGKDLKSMLCTFANRDTVPVRRFPKCK